MLLKLVPSFKYLGMTLDPTLSFSHHVSATIRCVQHKIILLSKVKKYLNADVALKIYKSILKLVPSFKYLGMTLDPTLSFSHHVSATIRCVQHKIILLSKVKKYLNADVALKIYKSMILPYLDYADVIYSKANVSDLDKLQRLQNRCLKLCQGRYGRLDSDRLHRDLRVPYLKARRKAHTLNFMYVRKSRRPDLLNRREIRTRAHDAPLFVTKVPRCEAFKRSVGYHGAVAWNDLSAHARNTGTYETFKDTQKKRMLVQFNQ